MTIRNLDRLLNPRSVALIGASEADGSVGRMIARNLLGGGFKGPIYFVNPTRASVLGHKAVPSVAALPEAPDLAIIATPAATVPKLTSELADIGCRAVIIITAGLGPAIDDVLARSAPSLLRILGPNCLGLMLPPLGLNASFAHRDAPAGDLAFLSQSGALLTSVIDWAASRSIGFSHVVSLGEMADVDFGDLLDYLATDASCRAILLYMEAVTEAPKFISAARRAARLKPVIVVKSGRHAAGAEAALSHTGRLAGADAAFDAAFRRSGLLRVKTLPDLFAAAEILSRAPSLHGERLAILTNGGGAGVLAADELQDASGSLSTLAPETITALNAVLPKTWSHRNPADIIGDADSRRYDAATAAILEDPNTDALLVMQCPTAITSSTENAQAVIDAVAAHRSRSGRKKLVMTNWLGDGIAIEARKLFADAKIPSFETPSDAVVGFSQLVRHARAGRELMRTPPAMRRDVPHDDTWVARELELALAQGRSVLSSVTSKQILTRYQIPVTETIVAPSLAHVAKAARHILSSTPDAHPACVVKILSDAISHKSDIGGVRLGLETAEAAHQAAEEMLARARAAFPEAQIDGFMVEPMIRRPHAQEVIAGMSIDPTFGPVLLFGAGGVAVEVLQDRALALPPLDLLLARSLIEETRIYRLLKGYRDRPPAALNALAEALVNLSELTIRHPEIREIDINPLLVDEHGVIALDARIRIENEATHPRAPLAIAPYPHHLEREIELAPLGALLIRPIRPEDEACYATFFAKTTLEDIRRRFFTPRDSFSHEMLARFTQIDYAREMAFVAMTSAPEMLAVVRLNLDPDGQAGEFGIIVRSDVQGRGLGRLLMQHLLDYAKARGVKRITSQILADNGAMLDFAKRLGFKIEIVEDDLTIREATIDL